MFKLRLLSLLFIISSTHAMELVRDDHESKDGFSISSKSAASDRKMDLESETHFNGFKEIEPVTLTAYKLKGYEQIERKLGNFSQFSEAFVYDKDNRKVTIHLPHAIVIGIIGNEVHIECLSLGIKDSDLWSELVGCSHSYNGPNVRESWTANNETVPKEIKWKLPATARFDSFEDIFDYVFIKNGYKGLIFGESHNDFTCRYTLIEMLPILVKKYGIETLFVEQPFELQPLLDQYFKFQTHKMPPELKHCLEYIDGVAAKFSQVYPANAGYVALIKAAKRAGIKSVKAIDNLLEYYCADKDTLDRRVTMNQDFPIYYDPNVRSIGFGGWGHSTTSRLTEQEKKRVYGLREISGLPAINIFSSLIQPNYGEPGIYFRESPQFGKPSGNSGQEQMEADFDIYVDLNSLM